MLASEVLTGVLLASRWGSTICCWIVWRFHASCVPVNVSTPKSVLNSSPISNPWSHSCESCLRLYNKFVSYREHGIENGIRNFRVLMHFEIDKAFLEWSFKFQVMTIDCFLASFFYCYDKLQLCYFSFRFLSGYFMTRATAQVFFCKWTSLKQLLYAYNVGD